MSITIKDMFVTHFNLVNIIISAMSEVYLGTVQKCIILTSADKYQYKYICSIFFALQQLIAFSNISGIYYYIHRVIGLFVNWYLSYVSGWWRLCLRGPAGRRSSWSVSSQQLVNRDQGAWLIGTHIPNTTNAIFVWQLPWFFCIPLCFACITFFIKSVTSWDGRHDL